jgi:uncharacterized protein YjbI with pentapeptide repeats
MSTRTISEDDLKRILAQNVAWLESKGAEGALVDLNHVDLRNSDLRRLPLYKANLFGADLRGADLSGAFLIGADLREANLNGAVMRDVDLRMTDLSKTELRDVQLIGANLSDANLSGVAFGKAHFMDTKLVRADLRECHTLSESNFINADLTEADLRGADMFQALFTQSTMVRAKLAGAKLDESNFEYTDLSGADLIGCSLVRAEFFNARLEGAVLDRANLSMTNLVNTNFEGAKLREAKLGAARLIKCSLKDSDLTGATVYGIAAWDILTEGAIQNGLVVTPPQQTSITVDDLEIAQFVYLLLSREKIRNLLDTITSKAVLILGRFTPERKVILDGIADELRGRNLVPIIFDFERSTNRDFTETIKTLAGLCMFVIADVTNPKSAPLELQATVPDYQIPFVTVIEEGQEPFSMLTDLGKYDWVLKPVVKYRSLDLLREAFQAAIVDRAFAKHKELQSKKAQELKSVSAEEFLRPKLP